MFIICREKKELAYKVFKVLVESREKRYGTSLKEEKSSRDVEFYHFIYSSHLFLDVCRDESNKLTVLWGRLLMWNRRSLDALL